MSTKRTKRTSTRPHDDQRLAPTVVEPSVGARSTPGVRAPSAGREKRCRARDLGVPLGVHHPGPYNAITDVAGVRVGHSTIIRGRGKLRVGHGPVRTGVTAILPTEHVFLNRLVGGAFVLNGAGEVSGLTQVVEWGLIETPILLTNTLSVGSCSAAAVRYMLERYPGIGLDQDVVIPLVGECDDSWLNDVAGHHVRTEHVIEALTTAKGGPVEEGNVGAGTGMITCDFKGGIGTSSRKLSDEEGGYTVGVLVLSNFGNMRDLRMGGIPVGAALAPRYEHTAKRMTSYGSIIAVFATDAPLVSLQLTRLSKRVALGIGRVGSYAAHGSGEIILGFSTANRVPRSAREHVYLMNVLMDQHMNPLYHAIIEATEEAILNAICMGDDMEGIDGNFAPGLPLAPVRDLVGRYRMPASQIGEAIRKSRSRRP